MSATVAVNVTPTMIPAVCMKAVKGAYTLLSAVLQVQ